MVCPFRVMLKKVTSSKGEVFTVPEYAPCYEFECPAYYIKGFEGGTGCRRADKELESED